MLQFISHRDFKVNFSNWKKIVNLLNKHVLNPIHNRVISVQKEENAHCSWDFQNSSFEATHTHFNVLLDTQAQDSIVQLQACCCSRWFGVFVGFQRRDLGFMRARKIVAVPKRLKNISFYFMKYNQRIKSCTFKTNAMLIWYISVARLLL